MGRNRQHFIVTSAQACADVHLTPWGLLEEETHVASFFSPSHNGGFHVEDVNML